MAYRSLPKFNPEARFVANRAFLFKGRHLAPGEPIADIPGRRLRQLYERRDVGVAPAAQRKEDGVAGAARKGKR